MTERLTDEALLPCPFCGGEADTMTPEADDMRAATVMCMGCYCTGKECETEAQAITAWNRRATPADDLRAAAEPDYCYNPEDWEYTQSWDARHELAESILDYGRDKEPARVSTLICGPDKWVARIPLDTDGDGEADDWENQWFDSEEAARAALSQNGGAA